MSGFSAKLAIDEVKNIIQQQVLKQSGLSGTTTTTTPPPPPPRRVIFAGYSIGGMFLLKLFAMFHQQHLISGENRIESNRIEEYAAIVVVVVIIPSSRFTLTMRMTNNLSLIYLLIYLTMII